MARASSTPPAPPPTTTTRTAITGSADEEKDGRTVNREAKNCTSVSLKLLLQLSWGWKMHDTEDACRDTQVGVNARKKSVLLRFYGFHRFD